MTWTSYYMAIQLVQASFASSISLVCATKVGDVVKSVPIPTTNIVLEGRNPVSIELPRDIRFSAQLSENAFTGVTEWVNPIMTIHMFSVKAALQTMRLSYVQKLEALWCAKRESAWGFPHTFERLGKPGFSGASGINHWTAGHFLQLPGLRGNAGAVVPLWYGDREPAHRPGSAGASATGRAGDDGRKIMAKVMPDNGEDLITVKDTWVTPASPQPRNMIAVRKNVWAVQEIS